MIGLSVMFLAVAVQLVLAVRDSLKGSKKRGPDLATAIYLVAALIALGVFIAARTVPRKHGRDLLMALAFAVVLWMATEGLRAYRDTLNERRQLARHNELLNAIDRAIRAQSTEA